MFVLYWAKISGERLQDHWSSGLIMQLIQKAFIEVFLEYFIFVIKT